MQSEPLESNVSEYDQVFGFHLSVIIVNDIIL